MSKTVILGTAGHIDHGKSSLVRALTGTDPDRLREEQERGMTIDLGFAHLRLPGGTEIGIVDVPGHQDFIRNMLAGVCGIDYVMLIVAADDGVMPQTLEHLQIVDLLHVARGRPRERNQDVRHGDVDLRFLLARCHQDREYAEEQRQEREQHQPLRSYLL